MGNRENRRGNHAKPCEIRVWFTDFQASIRQAWRAKCRTATVPRLTGQSSGRLPWALATMNSYGRFVSIAVLCLMLGGCYEAFPQIKSASVTYWCEGKPQGSAQQLSQEQVAKLSAWLQNHRWGWHPIIATYAPATMVSLTHADGTASSANLMKQVLIVGQSQRSLSETESQELHSLIGGQKGG